MLFVYKKEGLAPLNLYVEDEFDRASLGGTGGVKAITNYAPVRDSFYNVSFCNYAFTVLRYTILLYFISRV